MISEAVLGNDAKSNIKSTLLTWLIAGGNKALSLAVWSEAGGQEMIMVKILSRRNGKNYGESFI